MVFRKVIAKEDFTFSKTFYKFKNGRFAKSGVFTR